MKTTLKLIGILALIGLLRIIASNAEREKIDSDVIFTESLRKLRKDLNLDSAFE